MEVILIKDVDKLGYANDIVDVRPGYANNYLIEFEGEGDLVEKLETQYRRDERVIRFLTFRMDKYAVEYAEKRRNKNKSKQE